MDAIAAMIADQVSRAMQASMQTLSARMMEGFAKMNEASSRVAQLEAQTRDQKKSGPLGRSSAIIKIEDKSPVPLKAACRG